MTSIRANCGNTWESPFHCVLDSEYPSLCCQFLS
jgi:hypothetical protein